jgi:kynurenine/2-aminoadipate aminotransferase
MISLGGGMPNSSTFPFKSLRVELEGVGEASFNIEGKNMQEALQYSPTNGLPGLLAHLNTIMEAYHNESGSFDAVPRTSMVSTGSQDALSKVWVCVFMCV